MPGAGHDHRVAFPGPGLAVGGHGQGRRSRRRPAARAVFERVDAALGEPLSRLILEGPEDELTLTANAQPAIVADELRRARRHPRARPGPRASGVRGGPLARRVLGARRRRGAIARGRRAPRPRARPRDAGRRPAGHRRDERHHGDRARRDSRRSAGEAAERRGRRPPPTSTRPGRSSSPATRPPWRASGELVAAEKGRAIPLKVSAPFHCALMAPAARESSRAELERVIDSPPALSRSSPTSTRSPNTDRGARQGAARPPGRRRRALGGERPAHGASGASRTRSRSGPGKVLAGPRQAHRQGPRRS